ncbi:hypothetical protein AMELA_G00029210 [Ameiurus melas]|uniref:Uncharacterized protein n=1 Tax=Ameiurus melas TaxID=219545 RepID=A0A7J6BDD2_AMEME|nr:hypothetical protein AMELA_G00029210 [Ameiurus melas]
MLRLHLSLMLASVLTASLLAGKCIFLLKKLDLLKFPHMNCLLHAGCRVVLAQWVRHWTSDQTVV